MENPETINERIALLVRTYAKGRNTKFATMVGSSEGNIRGYINKGVMPKHDVLERIVKSLGINATWLITGEGPMVDEEPVVKYTGELVVVPMVDISAAAGNGFENPNFIDVVDRLELPTYMVNKRGEYLCIRLKGDSMAPSMNDSGYLVIRYLQRGEWESITNDMVYVVVTREGATFVKRIKNRLKDRGYIVCMSDNPDKNTFPNFNIYEEELQSVFSAEWYFTDKLSNIHEMYYQKVGDLQNMYDDLRDQMEEVRAKLGMKVS